MPSTQDTQLLLTQSAEKFLPAVQFIFPFALVHWFIVVLPTILIQCSKFKKKIRANFLFLHKIHFH